MGYLKSLLHIGFLLFVELPIAVVISILINIGVVSGLFFIILKNILFLICIYRIICFFLEIKIAGRINEYFAYIKVPYSNHIMIHQFLKKKTKEILKEKSCYGKVRSLAKTKSDILKILEDDKTYVTYTHKDIYDKLNEIDGIEILSSKLMYRKKLTKIQEQIFKCKKVNCSKINDCKIYKSGKEIKDFYYIKFTFKKPLTI